MTSCRSPKNTMGTAFWADGSSEQDLQIPVHTLT